jgi:dihydrofolate reductase
MRKIVAVENLSLDGVMQAPGRADEDLRGGFAHGGWSLPYNDAAKGRIMAGGMAQAGPLLFGRTTYEDFFRVWPNRTDNPFTAVLDNSKKYVASTTLTEPLAWKNSTLLTGDVPDAVARLKEQPGKDIVVLGSGVLVRSLMRRNLIDEFVLLIHPLVLGSGRRLFADEGALAALRLVDSQSTTTGVMIATYRHAEQTAGAKE